MQSFMLGSPTRGNEIQHHGFSAASLPEKLFLPHFIRIMKHYEKIFID
jgi:hypothetical protein